MHKEVIRYVAYFGFRERCLFEQIHAGFINDLGANRDSGVRRDELVCLVCFGRIVLDRQRIDPDVAVNKAGSRLWQSCAHRAILTSIDAAILQRSIIEFVTLERRKGSDSTWIL